MNKWWTRLRPELGRRDVLLLLAVLALVPIGNTGGDGPGPGPMVLVAGLITAGFALSRPAPAWSLTVAVALSSGVLLDGASPAAPMTASVVLGYLAGRRMADPGQARYAFGAVAAALLGAAVLGLVTAWVTVLLVQFGTAVLPWWAGSWGRQRRELRRAEEARVAQARLRERARIAQDMHDSLGHELSLMALTAGGLELAPGLPEEHRATAARLRQGAAAATERLHTIIGVLGERPVTPDEEDIPGLVTRARNAGLRVTLEQRGDPPASWGPAARQAARRVAQEALTNAIRHAPGAAVTIRVAHRDDEATVTVTNRPGPRPAAPLPGGGSGLVGLDERVRLAGGTFRAGPSPDGGFEVSARLPHPREHAALPDTDPPPPLDRARHPEPVRPRSLLRISALPLALAAALAAFLLGSHLYTVYTTGLAHTAYDRLETGDRRARIDETLPSHSVDEPPPVLRGPAPPPEAQCLHYRAGTDLLDLSGTMYRLCFRDGILVAKDVLRSGATA